MPTLRRAAAAVVIAVSATIVLPGATSPAAAHDISCYPPGDISEFGSYLTCQAATPVHEVEHEVANVAWIVYCYYEYLQGRPCF